MCDGQKKNIGLFIEFPNIRFNDKRKKDPKDNRQIIITDQLLHSIPRWPIYCHHHRHRRRKFQRIHQAAGNCIFVSYPNRWKAMASRIAASQPIRVFVLVSCEAIENFVCGTFPNPYRCLAACTQRSVCNFVLE